MGRSWDGSYDVKESFLATQTKMSVSVRQGEILKNKSKRLQIKPKGPEALAVFGRVQRLFSKIPELKITALSIRHMQGKTECRGV